MNGGTDASETISSGLSFENRDELIKAIEIEGTPFKRILIDGKSFVSLGEYRVTEPTEDSFEAYEQDETLKKQDWKILIAVMGAIIDKTIQQYSLELKEVFNKKQNNND